uniref:Uncharacterized protein n=1 Tax=Anguilla anguilla TaxID=7936 RepID=A0A0E9XXM8_ANGAN
MFVGNLVLNHS